LDRLTSSEQAYARENFLGVTILNLAHNQFRQPPVAIKYFENLKILNISYNQIDDMSNLFAEERVNESIETIDVSNNRLTKVPMNIWKWQRIHSLNLENNNIRNFAPEIGYLNLKNLAIGGNPSMLIKNRVSKNTVSLLAYLRDRLPANNTDMEYEVSEIQQRLSGRPQKKKKEKIPDYEFNDPFKANVDSYNRAQYNKYSGVDK
jgi:Leucine-rich repeat (LRR) protein